MEFLSNQLIVKIVLLILLFSYDP
ncbi:hypothetical protein PSEUDO8AS_40348 [Pseudomonas sp. 8AS]|nr:hypothetical protein PSEUDO8AS_40348 [Pseudomonas sp. 8AS]